MSASVESQISVSERLYFAVEAGSFNDVETLLKNSEASVVNHRHKIVYKYLALVLLRYLILYRVPK